MNRLLRAAAPPWPLQVLRRRQFPNMRQDVLIHTHYLSGVTRCGSVWMAGAGVIIAFSRRHVSVCPRMARLVLPPSRPGRCTMGKAPSGRREARKVNRESCLSVDCPLSRSWGYLS